MSRGPVRRRWRPLFVVVLGNALAQTLLVLPAAVPGVTVLFTLLFLASFLALGVSLALIAAAVSNPGPGRWQPAPTLRQWVAATLAPLVVGAAGLLSPFAIPVAVPIAVVLLAGAGTARRQGESRPGHPVALVLSVLATVVIAAAGWVLALLLGFFVTGLWAALLTWLCFGAATVGLLRWWSVLSTARSPRESRPTPQF